MRYHQYHKTNASHIIDRMLSYRKGWELLRMGDRSHKDDHKQNEVRRQHPPPPHKLLYRSVFNKEDYTKSSAWLRVRAATNCCHFPEEPWDEASVSVVSLYLVTDGTSREPGTTELSLPLPPSFSEFPYLILAIFSLRCRFHPSPSGDLSSDDYFLPGRVKRKAA